MIQLRCPVTAVHAAAPNIFILSFHAPQIASSVLPGQFVNVKVNDLYYPLLRRPFSVYHVSGGTVQLIFNVVGVGTKALSEKHIGDEIDVLGPLGCSYKLDGDYESAILVAGGLGVAPLPMISAALKDTSKHIVTFLGARTRDQLVPVYLENLHTSADDGTGEFHGTVVDYLRSELQKRKFRKPKIFACGPNPMLKALSELAEEYRIPCEVSLETVMACGIGICQGCPVETVDGERKYSLICKEGTVFDSKKIRLS
ncbi:MAG TPA: dihydroorotate dehydrogenase electron transfer subunit [Bacteroidota bacterium]|jgi:dihydroorotate dehydrogenase electron transfer subunit|nr:dihydroorotate dehydrogenase electron transfer subunit [Bacteroidota bacterium]